ncbi:MAG: preprotein translocase subunit SecG [Candidatus Paceibacterota bacterium]
MNIITTLQIITAIALIILILLQERSSEVSGIFGGGGSDGGGQYQKRRGLEKTLFQLTIILAIFFGALAVANLLI